MQLLQEAKEASLAIQKRAVVSCQASLSRHLHATPPSPAHPPCTLLCKWHLVVGQGADIFLPTGDKPRDSESFVSRLSGLASLYSKKGRQFRPLLRVLPSFLTQLPPPWARHTPATASRVDPLCTSPWQPGSHHLSLDNGEGCFSIFQLR